LAELAGRRVAIPGALTTANLLLSIFGPAELSRVPMRFDRIMPAVAAGAVDAGLIIHESRFTYPQHGLVEMADLGRVWEAATGLPLPLGVICASRALPAARIDAIESALRASVKAAFADPSASRDFVRAHAQEMTDDVCAQHIALYVGDFSADLGDEGRAAIEQLLARADPNAPSPWR
jgi:1,4-dihydroxy-6-naphthoate synthase